MGTCRVPGDKSISHRAVILGALAEGTTTVQGLLEGEDLRATVAALQRMGVTVGRPEPGMLRIRGVGRQGFKAPNQALNMGNSGTAIRLLAGVLAGQGLDATLSGDASLSRRPMGRIIEPLRAMGADITAAPNGTAPLHIHGGRKLRGIDYHMPIASAQVKSCLLLAGLNAEGRTCVREPAPSRDHTERMLVGFGCRVTRNATQVCVEGGGTLWGCNLRVPADISSAAFLIVGAAISPDSDITLTEVGVNPTRIGLIAILRSMGADIEILNERQQGNEPVADIRVRNHALHGIHISPQLVPSAIDEFPAIFIAAACAEGQTVLRGAGELRVKESDRIQVMAAGLQSMGIRTHSTDDGLMIEGGHLQGAQLSSHGDHRVAMAFSIAGLRSAGRITVHDCDPVETSYPGFVDQCRALGLAIQAH